MISSMSKKISAAEYPISKIFSSDFEYTIPSYQRPYAWSVVQAYDLFDDLYDFYKSNTDEGYFLGSIVLIKEENKAPAEVIDGQQRLTTLTILLAAIASKMTGKDKDLLLEKYIREAGDHFVGLTPNRERFGVNGFNFQEEGKPLMSADEIRRTDKTILFIRGNKPVLTTLPSIAEIAPWRKQIGINPFYGKRYLLPVRLRIGARKGGLLCRVLSLFRSKGDRP